MHSGGDKFFFKCLITSASLAINIAIVELKNPPTVDPKQTLSSKILV